MQRDLYVSVPYVLSKNLRNLATILGKAKAAGKTDSELLEGRLAADMFPLVKQIQIVSDNGKGLVSRMAGVDAPSMPDTETTVDACIERLVKTAEYVESFSDADFAGTDDRRATLSFFPGKDLAMRDYVLDMGLPNFFFHLVTSYGILRHLGVELGKADYIGSLPLHDVA